MDLRQERQFKRVLALQKAERERTDQIPRKVIIFEHKIYRINVSGDLIVHIYVHPKMTNYLQPSEKVQQNSVVVTVRGKQRNDMLRLQENSVYRFLQMRYEHI